MKYLKLLGGVLGGVITITTFAAQAQSTNPNSSESTMTPATATAQENFQAGNITRSVQQWSQSIREDTDVIHSLYNRAQAFIVLEQYEFALRDVQEIIEREPRVIPEVLLVQGIALSNLNRLPEAIASFDQAERQQPSALIYSNRAIVHQRAGNLADARADMVKAIALSPTPVNYLNLANLQVQDGEYGKAIENMHDVLARNATFFPAYLTRGIAYHHSGQHRAAIRDFLSALTISPNQPEARYYAGLSLEALDMREEAAQSLLAAADLYLQQNRPDSYHQVLEKMSELSLP